MSIGATRLSSISDAALNLQRKDSDRYLFALARAMGVPAAAARKLCADAHAMARGELAGPVSHIVGMALDAAVNQR